MLICDLDGEHDVEDDAAIEHVLSRRNGSGMNQFRLFRGRAEADSWPSLIILVNGEIAWLYFLLSSEHSGYHSVGAVPGLDPQGRTKFVSLGPQDEEFSNDQVVPFASALQAAKEFSVAAQLPRCMDWYDTHERVLIKAA